MSSHRKTAKQRPVVLSYCSHFLPRMAIHIYRQTTNLRQFDNWIVTRQRDNEDYFPYDKVHVLRKYWLRSLHRAWHRHVLGEPEVRVDWFETAQLRRLARRIKADLLHVYFGTVGARLIPYLRREARPTVVSFHGADTSDTLSQASLEGLVEAADLLLARSESLRQVLIQRGCPPNKVRLNPTGIPTPEHFDKPAVPVISETRPLRLIQACRFIEKKGIEVSLDAVCALARRGIPVQLDLAGSGPLEQALRTQVEALGLGGQVRFLGLLANEDLLARFPRYDFSLNPSKTTGSQDREGIPNSMLEAMAVGVPPVATRHSGIPEVIRHGENGLLIARADSDELAEIILEFLKTPSTYPDLSRRAHETVASGFSSRQSTAMLEETYLELIEAKQPSKL